MRGHLFSIADDDVVKYANLIYLLAEVSGASFGDGANACSVSFAMKDGKLLHIRTSDEGEFEYYVI
jgi:hypothetical protein